MAKNIPISKMYVELTDSIKTIEKKINKAIASRINSQIRKNKGFAHKKAMDKVEYWLRVSPELQEISSGGSLAGELGIRRGEGQAIAESIVMAVKSSTVFEYSRFDESLRGTAEFRFQPAAMHNLLSLANGFVSSSKGDVLHWLRWLLFHGSSPIITGYEFISDPGKGRSGLGTMGKGGMWRVPPQFSGTAANNFITRSFLGRGQEVGDIFEELLER